VVILAAVTLIAMRRRQMHLRPAGALR
jgi:hypothetical protein